MLDSRFDPTANSLDKSSDRRAWERVGRAIEGISKISATKAKMIAGIVGVKAASLFVESLSEKSVTGMDVLKSFDRVVEKLEKMPIENYPILNDDILGTLDSLDGVAKFTPAMPEESFSLHQMVAGYGASRGIRLFHQCVPWQGLHKSKKLCGPKTPRTPY